MLKLQKFKPSKNKIKHLLIFLSYLFLTIIFTWPILPNMTTKVTDTGDPFFVAWVVDSELDSIKSGDLKNFWNGNIFYPYKNTMAYSDHSLTLTLEALPVSFFTNNSIFIINYLQLLSFFLSAVSAYLLAHYYTKSKKAAFISGIIYGFGTYHVGQISHLQVASYQFVPLVILFFEKFLQKQSLKNGLLLSIFFLLNAFVSIYHLGFIIFPLLVVFGVRVFKKEIKLTKKFWLKSLLALGFTSLFLAPMLYPYYKVTKELNQTKPIEEHASFSANPIDFVVAPTSNLLTGKVSQKIVEKTPSAFWVEHTLYFGVFTISLAVLGFFSRKYIAEIKRKTTYIEFSTNQLIYALLIPICLVFALGPFLFSQSQKVKLPYYLLYKFIDLYKGVRVPTRISIIVFLSFAILAGYFFLKAERLTKWKKYAIFGVLGSLIALEHLSAPLVLITPPKINEELYVWTRDNLEKEAPALHFPFGREIEYQRGSVIDGRRTFNGYSGVFPLSYTNFAATFGPDFIYAPLENLSISSTLGIKYFMVHGEYLDKESEAVLTQKISEIIEVKLIKEIDGTKIFDISAMNNPFLYSIPTVMKGEVVNKNHIRIAHTNPTDTPWINEGFKNYKITIKYLLNDQVTKEKVITSLKKPIYLKPHEVFENVLKVSEPWIASYNKVEVIIE